MRIILCILLLSLSPLALLAQDKETEADLSEHVRAIFGQYENFEWGDFGFEDRNSGKVFSTKPVSFGTFIGSFSSENDAITFARTREGAEAFIIIQGKYGLFSITEFKRRGMKGKKMVVREHFPMICVVEEDTIASNEYKLSSDRTWSVNYSNKEMETDFYPPMLRRYFKEKNREDTKLLTIKAEKPRSRVFVGDAASKAKMEVFMALEKTKLGEKVMTFFADGKPRRDDVMLEELLGIFPDKIKAINFGRVRRKDEVIIMKDDFYGIYSLPTNSLHEITSKAKDGYAFDLQAEITEFIYAGSDIFAEGKYEKLRDIDKAIDEANKKIIDAKMGKHAPDYFVFDKKGMEKKLYHELY